MKKTITITAATDLNTCNYITLSDGREYFLWKGRDREGFVWLHTGPLTVGAVLTGVSATENSKIFHFSDAEVPV